MRAGDGEMRVGDGKGRGEWWGGCAPVITGGMTVDSAVAGAVYNPRAPI